MRPILAISYYANNKGTTDYFLDFLKNKQIPFYYLKHPLPEADIKASSLHFFDGQKEKLMASYSSPNSFALKMVYEFGLSMVLSISLRLKHRVRTIVGFGSVNVVAVLPAKLLGMKVIFWGVDYSPKRFSSVLLNKIYLYTETLACLFSDMVLQPTGMQQAERLKKHRLKNSKSKIIPNGVVKIDNLDLKEVSGLRLIYVGSITPQHGVLNFIKHAYGEMGIRYPLTIFGDGIDLHKTKEYVQEHSMGDLIDFKGSQPPSTVEEFVKSSTEKLIGIAPYNNDDNGHVGFGDSLKLKEYVNLGLPYIASSAVVIDKDLQKLGLIYNTPQELRHILQKNLESLELSPAARKTILPLSTGPTFLPTITFLRF